MDLLRHNPLKEKTEASMERKLRSANTLIVLLTCMIMFMFVSGSISTAIKEKANRDLTIQLETSKSQVDSLEKQAKELKSQVNELITISKRTATVNHYYYFYEGELIGEETEPGEVIDWTKESATKDTMVLPQ
jgi:preprotein translocase subunit SecF